MPLKNFFFWIFCLGTGFLAVTAWAQELGPDTIQSRYSISLPMGDSGTVYLNEDHVMTMLPYFNNQKYVHNCWGRWSFDEKNQRLTIREAKLCRVLNGSFKVTRDQNNLVLKDGLKTLTFKGLPHRR